MNVLYRGVDNPLEVSVPGVDPANLIVSGAGVKKTSNGYIADVTKQRGGELKISVSVKDGDKTKNMGSKVFRVKQLPGASGEVFGKTEGLMSAGLLKKAKVDAKFQNFDFELPLRVTAFQIIIPPFAPIDCRGNTLSSNAKAALEKAKPGTPVIIRNIKATTAKGIKPKVVLLISLSHSRQKYQVQGRALRYPHQSDLTMNETDDRGNMPRRLSLSNSHYQSPRS